MSSARQSGTVLCMHSAPKIVAQVTNKVQNLFLLGDTIAFLCAVIDSSFEILGVRCINLAGLCYPDGRCGTEI